MNQEANGGIKALSGLYIGGATDAFRHRRPNHRPACDALAARGQVYALETGQETAQTLKRFIEDVNRENLKVNFDPANMILYGNDEPTSALDVFIRGLTACIAKTAVGPRRKVNWTKKRRSAKATLTYKHGLSDYSNWAIVARSPWSGKSVATSKGGTFCALWHYS